MYSKINAYLNPSAGFYSTPSGSRHRSLSHYESPEQEALEESDYYSSHSSGRDTPLRFIIIRHGERVDVMFGAGWTARAFSYGGEYYPFDPNMPPSLPLRGNWQDYDVDTPLTAKGLGQSWNVGNVLARYNLPVTACYSSPAFRSIQTADRILEGMNRKTQVPLRLELGLFECTSWYAQSPINFMSDPELLAGGYNIDTRYRSQVSNLRLLENEYQYYDRSKEAMKKIIKIHKNTGGTILLVAHAPSLEVLTRHLMNGQPRPERLAELAGKVDFCSMTIVERDSAANPWQFRYSLDQQNNWQQQQFGQGKDSLIRSRSQGAPIQPAMIYQTQKSYPNIAITPTDPQTQFFAQQEAYPPHFVV